jgi:hypothetical protein
MDAQQQHGGDLSRKNGHEGSDDIAGENGGNGTANKQLYSSLIMRPHSNSSLNNFEPSNMDSTDSGSYLSISKMYNVKAPPGILFDKMKVSTFSQLTRPNPNCKKVVNTPTHQFHLSEKSQDLQAHETFSKASTFPRNARLELQFNPTHNAPIAPASTSEYGSSAPPTIEFGEMITSSNPLGTSLTIGSHSHFDQCKSPDLQPLEIPPLSTTATNDWLLDGEYNPPRNNPITSTESNQYRSKAPARMLFKEKSHQLQEIQPEPAIPRSRSPWEPEYELPKETPFASATEATGLSLWLPPYQHPKCDVLPTQIKDDQSNFANDTGLIFWASVNKSQSMSPQAQAESRLACWQPPSNDQIVVKTGNHREMVICNPGDNGPFPKYSTHSHLGKYGSQGSTCSISDLESQDYDETLNSPGGNDMLIHIYFKTWNIATIVMLIINCANMDWVYLFKNEPWWMICLSIFFFGIQAILQWSVLELPLMSFASAFVKAGVDRMADGSHLTIIINYNLLASYRSEVDATLVNAFSAYIGNLSPTVACVLVSATGDPELKEYELLVRDNLREQIFELVISEGKAWAAGTILDEGRANRVFEPFRDRTGMIDENFVQLVLPSLATKYAKDFMVVQRVTRVLRKCGQYQDLMLLSEGDNSAWTYTDKEHYKEAAREYGEPLFHISEDVENVQGRRFDYTLVLDGDTGVVKNSLSTLLDVAAANPLRAIVQPAIRIVAKDDQSLFMHIDKMRQEINEPITAALTTLLGRSGFYGKGLIQNKYYIKALLGTRDNPIEKVPIDVLSHDTFEAGALSPLYVSSVQLLEEPCGNYVTWDIRECRWNRGELLLAHYFFPHSLGRLFEWMMCRVRKTPPTKLILRYETHLDDAGAYIAHSALRQMMLKPLLLFYIICRVFVKVYFFFNWLPLVLMVLLVLVLPKVPLTTRHNWHKVIADVFCCILQYSPEPITGTIRVFKSARAHISGVSGWVPQFKVEQDFLIRPAVVATFAYQWRLFLLTCASLAPIIIFRPKDYLLMFLFAVTAFIPIYTTLTALPYSSWKRVIDGIKFYLCCKCFQKKNEQQRFNHNQRHSHRMPNDRSIKQSRQHDGDDRSACSNRSLYSQKSFYSSSQKSFRLTNKRNVRID